MLWQLRSLHCFWNFKRDYSAVTVIKQLNGCLCSCDTCHLKSTTCWPVTGYFSTGESKLGFFWVFLVYCFSFYRMHPWETSQIIPNSFISHKSAFRRVLGASWSSRIDSNWAKMQKQLEINFPKSGGKIKCKSPFVWHIQVVQDVD